MNEEKLSIGNAPQLTVVSAEELTLVSGGSIWSAIKHAAVWVKDHVFVDVANHVVGGKGKF